MERPTHRRLLVVDGADAVHNELVDGLQKGAYPGYQRSKRSVNTTLVAAQERGRCATWRLRSELNVTRCRDRVPRTMVSANTTAVFCLRTCVTSLNGITRPYAWSAAVRAQPGRLIGPMSSQRSTPL